MKARLKVRYASLSWLSKLGAQLLSSEGNVTILHLGRGGIHDGKLDDYNRMRVIQTLAIARAVALLRPNAAVQIIWSGGCNRQQDRTGTPLLVTEAGAALKYAEPLLRECDRFTMAAEEHSTSTVENATESAKIVSSNDAIVVVTDPLHYWLWKVQLIAWLVYPHHRRIYVELPTSPPDTNWKKIAVHAVSTCTTVIGMTFVRRGDAVAIQRRQRLLQKWTRH